MSVEFHENGVVIGVYKMYSGEFSKLKLGTILSRHDGPVFDGLTIDELEAILARMRELQEDK